MPPKSAELLMEARVAQLEEISERRNSLLRQMHQMMQRRNDVGSVLTLDDEDGEDLKAFLQRFHMPKDNPEVGSIAKLDDSEAFAALSTPDSTEYQNLLSVDSKPQSARRETRSQHRVVSDPEGPSPSIEPMQYSSPMNQPPPASAITPDALPACHSNSPPPSEGSDDGYDELDLLRRSPRPEPKPKPPRSLTAGTSMPGSALSGDEPNTEERPLDGGDNEFLGSNAPLTMSESGLNAAESDGIALTEGSPQQYPSLPDNMDVDVPDTTGNDSEEVVDQEHLASVEDDITSNEITEVNRNRATPEVLKSREASHGLEVSHEDSQSFLSETGDATDQNKPPDQEITYMTPSPVRSPRPDNFVTLLTPPVRRSIMIPAPTFAASLEPSYIFDGPSSTPPATPVPVSPTQPRHQYNPNYTIPPFKLLHPDTGRKIKSTKQRKREKNEGRKDSEWAPIGLNRWAATVNANPVWKKVSRASKCLSTREWAIAMSELRLIRTIERIEKLKREGRWSFRQPKKQRGVGGLTKTHWDHLIDEMKWMRIDFREERKWKTTLAYNISTAVLEWHAAGTLEARISLGICVYWKRPRVEVDESLEFEENLIEDENMEVEADESQQNTVLLGVDYGSDEDDEDDEPDGATQSVNDSLAPSTLIQDALDHNNEPIPEKSDTQEIQPKTEQVDDTTTILRNNDESMDVDSKSLDLENNPTKLLSAVNSSGLKITSADPILGSKPTPSSSNGDTEPSAGPLKPSSKVNAYAPFRELVAYSDSDKLFLDWDDLEIPQAEISASNIPSDASIPPPDLAAIFPDLPTLTLLDISPVVQSHPLDGKKRSDKRSSDRDDPSKRSEDITYMRLFPAGEFMFTKPTLLGPLRPSKNWKNGQWLPIDEGTATSDTETPAKIPDESTSELFDSRSNTATSIMMAMQLQAAFLKDKDKDSTRKRTEHLWTASDDALLKTYIDKYPNNWGLIAECFNASRLTISTDRRTPRDCLERWSNKWGPESRRPADSPAMVEDTPPATPSQMTTRGHKRLASTSVSGPSSASVASGTEPRKRRRHQLVYETIKKAVRKRADALQKAQAAQRKPPAIHETHAQYSKMPKRTPAELSRMKAEKEAQEMQATRKRQEDLNRQNLMRYQQELQQTDAQKQQQAIPQQPGQQPPAGTAQRLPVTGIPPAQGVPQIRSQVNISQQQRIATPSMPAGAPRLSPQQLMHVHARAAQQQQQTQQAQVHAQALAQAQSQAQNNGIITNGNLQASNPHLSPPYTSRDNTSSPAHVSPPHNPAVLAAVNSPRPPSAQAHPLLQAAQVAGNSSRGSFYLPNVPGYTTEQIHTALRMQHQQQQAQQQQQQQSTGFPPPS